jgi:type IV pilus assembly protein PilY1
VANLDLTNATQKAFYDGYPIFKDWTNLDPYAGGRNSTSDYARLKSNIALIGDVNTDSRYTLEQHAQPHGRYQPGQQCADIEGFCGAGLRKGNDKDLSGRPGVSRTTSNPNTANSSPNTRGAQVYGLSYWAHTHDIRGTTGPLRRTSSAPAARVKSFFFDVNEYAQQATTTRGVMNNQYYTAGKYGGFNTQPDKDISIPNTTRQSLLRQERRRQQQRLAGLGQTTGAQTYFLQSNARGVLAAFEKIFTQAASAQRSIAGAAASGSNLTQGGSHFYQASFDTGNWTGDVQAFNVKVASDNVSIDMASGAAWSAEQELSNRLMAGTPPRNIIVGIRGANPSPTATPSRQQESTRP